MRKTINGSLEKSAEIIKFLDYDYSIYPDYNKFLLVWMSFNSFYYDYYPKTHEKNGKQIKTSEIDKVVRFSKESSSLFNRLVGKEEFKNVIAEFSATGRNRIRQSVVVEGDDTKEVYFGGQNNKCINFLKVLYQIRCNLIHGGKDLKSEENRKLVSWAYKYMGIFWREFLRENNRF